MPSSYVCFHTGHMMIKVRNNEAAVITWEGGNCCVPSACRNNPSTTKIRTKQVVINMMAGAKLNTVNNNITCKVEESPSGLVHFSGPPASGVGRSIFAAALD